VSPDEDSTRPAEDQEHGGWRKRPARRPRTRSCLLKGCDQRFHPRQARERYCSQQCRQAARQWSRWKAQQSYRATAAGKEKRNGQNRRYRERVRKRQQPAAQEDARVITKDFFDHCCDRPGCYEGFPPQSRSPLQRFCSRACRRAMERVWQRERRWRRARTGG